jgi:hypothetical protein
MCTKENQIVSFVYAAGETGIGRMVEAFVLIPLLLGFIGTSVL